VVGLNVYDMYEGEEVEQIKRALKGEELSYQTVYSDNLFFAVSYTPVFDDNEQFKYSIGVAMDITELKKAENQLRASNKELRNFTYVASHNLREPVSNIIGLIKLYNKENPSDEFNQIILENLEKSGQQLDKIVKDLHQIISVKKKEELPRKYIELQTKLDTITESIAQKIKDNKAEIHCDFTQAAVIQSFESYIDSIFQNLLTNAIKYKSPKRAPIIHISSKEAANFIQVDFKDNGLGIDLEKNRHQLFGLYTRFHKHVKGTGLGLYLVKNQMEALGGKIEVTSAINEGTTFHLYFPKIT